MQKTRDVLVLLWSSTISSGRDFLTGFAEEAHHHANWRLHLRLGRAAPNPMLVRAIRDGAYAALVVDERLYLSLREESGLLADHPIVVFGTFDPNAPDNVVFVQNDNAAIGRYGYEYLRGLGNYRTFAFVPDPSAPLWSTIRRQSFLGAAQRDKRTAVAYDFSDGLSLPQWLQTLEKPAAVLSACDNVAREVAEACQSAKIEIPRQLALVGVDNDELVCEFDAPTLSSILPRHDLTGRLAAKALAKALKGWPAAQPHVLVCDEQTIVERESSAPITPAAHLISSALAYIRANATKAITVGDVVRHLGVSRSLADLRFRQFQGESIGAAINRARLEAVKKRLTTTQMPAAKVARSCGFTNIPHLQVMFKRAYGLPMKKWRNTRG